jgi:hypothetical protein
MIMKNQILVTGCMKDGGLYKIDLWNNELVSLYTNGDFRGITKYRHQFKNRYIVVSNEYGILKLDKDFKIIQQNEKSDLDFHGAAIYRNRLYIVETEMNAIGIYDLDQLIRIDEIRFSTINYDVLHVNDIYFCGNRLFISMFSEKPNWRESEHKSGVVAEYSLSQNKIVKLHFQQLNKPHSIVCSNNDLYFCNTFEWEVRKGREVILRTKMYPRGLAIMDDIYFVGLSTSRKGKEQGGSAEVLIYNRSTQTSRHIVIPCKEIYGLLII